MKNHKSPQGMRHKPNLPLRAGNYIGRCTRCKWNWCYRWHCKRNSDNHFLIQDSKILPNTCHTFGRLRSVDRSIGHFVHCMFAQVSPTDCNGILQDYKSKNGDLFSNFVNKRYLIIQNHLNIITLIIHNYWFTGLATVMGQQKENTFQQTAWIYRIQINWVVFIIFINCLDAWH